ncbi:DNA (cytosine-5-)-methyltransferase [Aestuariibacter salexigens]|uniref:DNA (cytosine-5-)-methyltransferase n=1 Tax=Aestuariibacter salexigens TaxID=226010 RepID=UPI00040EA775|nr:DNA (cytosine-5-)-methyltransferase [Aestuariibacter salexigens]
MTTKENTVELLTQLLEIYDQKQIAEKLNPVTPSDWCRETINRVLNGKSDRCLTDEETHFLKGLLPAKPDHYDNPEFTFIDLFAGIGGLRRAFDSIGGKCVFTSEWNKFAVRTYKANYYSDIDHTFNEDIRDVTLSNREDVTEEEAYEHIKRHIGHHDVLLAGFPCQPFSLAGVSKKNALGRSHGFECEAQGTLFFDVCRIIKACEPSAFVLENVKNLKSHDKGNTFRVILEALDELGYDVVDVEHGKGSNDPKIIDGANYLPQHRERIVLVGFKKQHNIAGQMSLNDIRKPDVRPALSELLEEPGTKELSKYTLTPRLWEYLFEYAKKHQAKGNGFGYGLVDPNDRNATCRTLSARYHKDGSEILIDRGWDSNTAESDFWNEENQENRPRRLTPRECARIMGFDKAGESNFVIPVSDTQAYRQFGNSVVVPVFEAVAELMKPWILEAISRDSKSRQAA